MNKYDDFDAGSFKDPDSVDKKKPKGYDDYDPSGFRDPDRNVPVRADEYKVPEWVKKMDPKDKLVRGVKDRLGVMKRAVTSPILSNDNLRRAAKNLAFAAHQSPEVLTPEGAKAKLAEYAKDREKYQYEKPYFADSGMYSLGDTGTGVAAGMAVPFSKGTTLLGTAAKQFLPNAVFEAATNEGDALERTQAGFIGGLGASGGTGVVGLAGKAGRVAIPRALNKTGRFPTLRTEWQNPLHREAQDLADDIGAPLALGDIIGGPLDLIRKSENWLPGLSHREPVLKAQGDALLRKLHPNNTVQEGMEKTGKALKVEADKIFAPVNAKIGKTTLLVPTDNMHSAVRELRDRFPTLFTSEIKDTKVRDMLNNFADETNPPALSFEEFRKIQQAVGKAGARAKDLYVAKDIEKDAVNLANSAYAKAMDDIDNWGSTATGASKKTAAKYKGITDEWKSAMDRWKTEILPYENNAFYKKVMDPEVTPEQTLKATMDPMLGTARENIVGPYLKKHSPETAKLFDTVKLLNRAADNITKPADEHGSHILDTLIAIGHPGIVGTQTAISKGSASPFLKDVVLSRFDDLLPTTGFAGLPTSLGREYGEGFGLGGLGILDLLSNVGKDDETPFSSMNQEGTR